MTNTNTIAQLNDLLELLHDSHKGYQECAANLSEERLKNLCTHLSDKRESMIKDLEKMIQTLKGTPITSGSATGVLHRLFIDLKGLITANNHSSIEKEIERGEGYTIERYQNALNGFFQSPEEKNIQELIQHQLVEIQNDLTHIKESMS